MTFSQSSGISTYDPEIPAEIYKLARSSLNWIND